MKERSHTRRRHGQRGRESVWWWEGTSVSMCCKQNHVISRKQYLTSCLLSPAPPLTWILPRTVAVLLLPLCCASVKGKLQGESRPNSTEMLHRSCLKTAITLDSVVWLKLYWSIKNVRVPTTCEVLVHKKKSHYPWHFHEEMPVL